MRTPRPGRPKALKQVRLERDVEGLIRAAPTVKMGVPIQREVNDQLRKAYGQSDPVAVGPVHR